MTGSSMPPSSLGVFQTKMPPQAALAQEGMMKNSDYSDYDYAAGKKLEIEAGLPRIHQEPLRWEKRGKYRSSPQ